MDSRIGSKRKRRYFNTRQKAQAAMNAVQMDIKRHDKTFASYSALESMEMAVAHERCKELGSTLTEAVAMLQRDAEARSSGNITELIDECMTDKEADGLRPRSLYALRNRLENFRDEIDESRVGCITSQMIKQHIASKGWACKTKNGCLGDIKTFFSWLVGNEHITVSPAHRIKPFKKSLDEETSDATKMRLISNAQVECLFRSAELNDRGLIPFMALGFFGGLRPEREVPAISPNEIDWDEMTVHVQGKTTKDRQSRYVELNPTLEAWLKSEGGELPAPEPNELRRRWSDLRKKCDLFGDNWPHDAARHCYASNYLATHTADETIKQLGHGDYEMLFTHYRSLIKPRDAMQYWDIMPSSIANYM